MPFKIPTEQDTFKFSTASNGLPIAEFERWGVIHYALCCPLCGCIHELGQEVTHGATFTPKCLLKITHPTVFANWRKLQPEAIKYNQIVLKQRGIALEPDELIHSPEYLQPKAA